MRNIISNKQWFFTCLLTGIVLIIVYSFSNIKKDNTLIIVDDEPSKYILYWTKMFEKRDFELGLGNNIFDNCTYKNCFTTDNKSLIPLEEFSAILFHGAEFSVNKHGIPTIRSPHQVYVYSNLESPLNSPFFTGLEGYDNFFNWTMTYRTDSDIIRGYGYVRPQDTGYKFPSVEEIKKKKKRIAWFVSNCMTSSKRNDLAQVINKYYPVDIYGKCGNLSCSKRNNLELQQCYNMVESDYTYYFSAENSLCRDYVTEKVFYVLKKNVVPIVYGGANYEKLTPPHSVIDVSEFQSVKELVDFLNYLDSNIDEYMKYFEWKKNFVIDTTSDVTLCSLCEKLHKPIEPQSCNIRTWWFEEAMCKTGKMLPEIVKSVVTNHWEW